jgi:A/G-specific adenine glycosylase
MRNNGKLDQSKVVTLRRKLLKWYKTEGREFSWRETQDPFKILIAEIMLQRTKAQQVEPVYNEFISKYHSPRHILDEFDSTIYSELTTLGLTWRINTILESADFLINKWQGIIPSTKDELMKIPGVGQYIAGAVITTAFNKQCPLLDSNIVRLFSRYMGFKQGVDARSDKRSLAYSKFYAKSTKPRLSTYAIVDFSALICKPINPSCNRCIFNKSCAHAS